MSRSYMKDSKLSNCFQSIILLSSFAIGWMCCLYLLQQRNTIFSYHDFGNGHYASLDKRMYLTSYHDRSIALDNISTSNDSISDLVTSVFAWSLQPKSFCFGNPKSEIVITTISALHRNTKHLRMNWTFSNQFLYFSRLNRVLYALKYNYSYCEFPDTFDSSKPPHYSKLNVIRILLHYYKFVVWVDLDTMFHIKSQSIETKWKLDTSKSVEDCQTAAWFVKPNSDSQANFNGGCMVWQQCFNNGTDITTNLIEEAYTFEKLDESTYEQKAISTKLLANTEISKYIHIYNNYELRIQEYGFSQSRNMDSVFKDKSFNQPYFNCLVWHFTGDNHRYDKMVALLKPNTKLEFENVLQQSSSMFEIVMQWIDKPVSICDFQIVLNSLDGVFNEKEKCIQFLRSSIKNYYPLWPNSRKNYKTMLFSLWDRNHNKDYQKIVDSFPE